MNLSEAFSQIDSMGLSSPKFNLSEMTDEEAIMAELRKRGLVL